MSPWWKNPTEESQSESEAAQAEPATPVEQPQKAPTPKPPTRSEASTALTAATILELDAEGADLDDLPAGLKPAKASDEKSGEEKPRVRRRTTRRSKKSSDDGKEEKSEKSESRSEKPASTRSSSRKASSRKTSSRKTAARKSGNDEESSESRSTASAKSDAREESGANGSLALLVEALREALSAAPDSDAAVQERRIALFCDLENVALGVRDSDEVKKFDIDLVLERLLEKGKIIVKKAYADWQRYSDFKRPLHTAGIELIDIPQKYYSGKNSADIKMVVDALDICFTNEHLDTFVILSGDSDFTPLVSKLKENNKHVICVGVKSSSSKLLIDNCDEFIYYEDIWRDSQAAPQLEGLDEKTAECFSLMTDAIQALQRDNKTVLWGSMIKQTMQRKRPSFAEGYYGYSSFSDLLEDAEKRGLVSLKKDARSGSYIVAGFAGS